MSGEIIVADNDGVVAVNRNRIAEVIERLPAIRKAGAEFEARVKPGLEVPDFFQCIIDAGKAVEIP